MTAAVAAVGLTLGGTERADSAPWPRPRPRVARPRLRPPRLRPRKSVVLRPRPRPALPPVKVVRPVWYRTHDPRLVRVWPLIGYRYYAGGSDYTVVTTQPNQSSANPSANQRYRQMLELVELICQWRMLNESPAVQNRIPEEGSPGWQDAQTLLSEWKRYNSEFDRLSRLGLRELAAGRAIDELIEQARQQLDRLTKLVEKLPKSA